jgi:Flp pilus assembly protein TadB
VSAAAVALLLTAALLCWPVRSPVAVRARWLAARDDGSRAAAPSGPADARRRWLLAGAAGLAAGLLVGGVTGVVVAGLVAVGGERLLRRGGQGDARAGPPPEEDLPVACDLLAVCLEAGLPVGGALAAVATALPRPARAGAGHGGRPVPAGGPTRRAWDGRPGRAGRAGPGPGAGR